jgi:DNA uptake protein ComE-like DNA-binding protein
VSVRGAIRAAVATARPVGLRATLPAAVRAAALIAAVTGAMLARAAPAWAQSPEETQRRTEISPRVGAQQPNAALLRGRLDVNRATLEELQQLPVPALVAQNLWSYRTYVRFFRSMQDLLEVEGVTTELLAKLWPLVATLPPDPKDEALQRYDASFRQVQQFLAQEGASEELAEEYLDQLRDPQDVNTLNLYELQTFQNVSPVDAVAILKARKLAGRIENERQLRGADGLSYFAFRNLRDFVTYQPPQRKADELRGDAQLLYFDTPYTLDDADLLVEPQPGVDPLDFEHATAWGVRGLDNANPGLLTKLRLRLGNELKGGLMTFRNVGEEHLNETAKGYVSWKPQMNGKLALENLVVGNYRIAFGQGLVMDNTDYFLPRKTGTGFNKRPQTLLGDLSRSHEFALQGIAAEGSAGPLHGVAFYSNGHKDGLLNPDGTVNKYVVMLPRLTEEELAGLQTAEGTPLLLRRDAFHETVYGGNLKLQLTNGSYVGVSGYEARYDKHFNPDVNSLIAPANRDLLDSRDSELFADYDSRRLGKFRRVVGAEFQTVYANAALQGEYAKLDSSPDSGLQGLFSAAPDAFVLNGWVQYEDLTLQALYRSIDLGFDNPYARSFSNDTRYEQTLLTDPFRLQNPVLTWLELDTPQMKPERGLFLSTRYRVSRKLTISGLEYDQWKRVADEQDQRRWTARLEYAPIFPVRFRLRERFSSRSEMGTEDFRKFKSWDTRLEMRLRLSDYDELGLLYSSTNTQFAPRARLSQAAQISQNNPLAQAASPGQAVQALLTHNVNDGLTVAISTEMYDGFLFNFEDNEFVVVDGKGFRNWILLRSRLSDSLLLRFKVTNDRRLTQTNVDIRSFNDPSGSPIDGDNARRESTAFRLQLDYTF